AMAMCEKSLGRCVDQPVLLNALAFAANRCEAPWVTTTSLNALRIFHPNNEANLRKLAAAMQKNNQAQDALRIFQMIAKRHPSNLAIQNELREAMAVASIEHGSWEKDASTQEKANDSKDAVLQQLLQGTIHDADQAQLLIDKFQEMLAATDSIDIRRKLADAYMVKGDYEGAYDQYKTVAEKLGVDDPVLDKQIENAYISMLKSSIATLESNPDAYDDAAGQIAQLTNEIEEYRRRHIFARAEKFPNDKQLQFDLAEYYYEKQEYEKAKEVFEAVADNPLKRRASLVYISRCLLKMDSPAEAIPLLEEAISEMIRMDKYKREALYYLGIALQRTGNVERAVECFRSVRNSMPNYRDIQERIDALVNEHTEQ
ncbi:MAG: tetratricopeptide repeat protein, partial [Lentisphaeria bacterium]|nr:tetratricopeptide repeat protein [Lentisphaeria bacterium]